MASEQGNLKISLDSLGMTLSTAMPSYLWKSQGPSTLLNCAPESLQKSFVFVSENGDDDSGSIVVLGKNSLEAIQTQSLASFQQIHRKSTALDCQSIISSLTPTEVEKKLTEVLQENLKLKETLDQNSLAMKKHFTDLMAKQDELAKLREARSQKFMETKNLVNQLKLENNELKMKAQQKADKIDEKETKDQSCQIVAENKEQSCQVMPKLNEQYCQTENQVEERVMPEISMKSVDNEFAEEMLKLAERSEEQAKEIAHLKKVVESLNHQLEPIYQNLFTGIQLEHVRLGCEPPPEDSYRQHFLESFTHYKEKLQALGHCYASQVSRYTSIQECLQRCSEILSDNQKAYSTLSEDSRSLLESQSRKELQDHRSRLVEEELKAIVERQEMIQAQNEFQKIFTHYNSTLLELESLRQENDRSKSLKTGVSLHERRLDEAKANLKEAERLLETQRRGIEKDRQELSQKKEELEFEKIRLQDTEQRLVEANSALTDEIFALKETNDVLQQQCKLYEEDFDEERKRQENLVIENNRLLEQLSQRRG